MATLAMRVELGAYDIDIAGSPGSANGSDLQLWDCEYNMSLTDQKWLLFWY